MSAYDESAETYLASGLWPIPVTNIPNNVKPAYGATGYNHEVTYGKVNAWLHSDPAVRARAGRTPDHVNIGLRHDLTIAIDVDEGYGAKNGVSKLAEFAAKHGLPPLPPTWSSTARGDDSGSRQYVYDIRALVDGERPKFKTKPCDSVELCVWHHRFTVCAPSIHPKTGTPYAWYLPGGEPGVPPGWGERTDRYPRDGSFTPLPVEWFEAFRSSAADLDADAQVVSVQEFLATLPAGEPDALVRHLHAKWSDPAEHIGHDEFKNHLINAFMLGREGHPGSAELVDLLVQRHTAYLQQARPEVLRKGPNGRNELDDLLVATAEIAQRKRVDPAAMVTAANTPAAPEVDVSAFLGVEPEGSDPFVVGGPQMLSEEFWAARPVLGRIRQAAHDKNRSGDVVLLVTLARLAAVQHHNTVVDTGLGEASLNMIVCAVGPSSGGKTTSIKIARRLVEPPFAIAGAEGFRDGLPPGSGEGVAEMFMGYEHQSTGELTRDGKEKTVKVRTQVRHNAYMVVDEGEQLFRLAERSGSTIMTTLRSAWVGETLGQANASEESTRIVPANSYSLGVVIGLQPGKCGTVFDEITGGTPQRFLWAWTNDTTIPVESPGFPGTLDLASSHMARTLTVDESIRRRLRTEDRLVQTGELVRGELDGHQPLHLTKLSALLAILDGREHVTEDDWSLAEQVWAMSCSVRDHVRELVSREARRQQVASYHREAEKRIVVAEAEETHQGQRVSALLEKVTTSIARKVWRHGPCTKRTLTQAIAGPDRKEYGPGLVVDAINLAVERGWIEEKAPEFHMGEHQPPGLD